MKARSTLYKLRIIYPILLTSSLICNAQCDYWQQKVKYTMYVNVDAQNDCITGTQKLEYWNNSPDTLRKVFYHLYWNAFHPNSMMDQAGRNEHKVNWINQFTAKDIGYQHVKWVKVNGVLQRTNEYETIMVIALSDPILPHSKSILKLQFEAKIPSIKGVGKNNYYGIRYTMGEWYPKLCAYDRSGWHPDPSLGNDDSYGVWGDYDVSIVIDKRYILGATGFLENAQSIGYGYAKPGMEVINALGNRQTWHFIARQVHDFAWAADPNYVHVIRKIPGGPEINILYVHNRIVYDKVKEYSKQFPTIEQYWANRDSLWNELADAMVTVYSFIKNKFGDYPYPQYSIIQAGQGGTSYPAVAFVPDFGFEIDFHEWMHQWYYGMLASNECNNAWMEEGFTTWAAERVENYYITVILKGYISPTSQLSGVLINDTINEKFYPCENLHRTRYNGYFDVLKSNKQEPLTTWSDNYHNTIVYAMNEYSKGLIFLEQLGYIVGVKNRDKILIEYYRLWRFKYPSLQDFIDIAEKVSGMQLGWYGMYWINTTKVIDYGIDSVWNEKAATRIRLDRIGSMPMPIDLLIEYKDGSSELLYLPTDLTYGSKPIEDNSIPRKIIKPWKFTDRYYDLLIEKKISSFKRIQIDPTARMADVVPENNCWLSNDKLVNQ